MKTVEDHKSEKTNKTVFNKSNEDIYDKSCDKIDNTVTINHEGPLDKINFPGLQAKCESDIIKPGIELDKNNLESSSPSRSAGNDSGKTVSFSPNNKKVFTRSLKRSTNKKTSYDINNHNKPQDNRNMETDISHNLIDFSNPQLKHQAVAIISSNKHDKTNYAISSPKSIDKLNKNEIIPVSPNKMKTCVATESSDDKISTDEKNSLINPTNKKDGETSHCRSDQNKNACESKFGSPAKMNTPKDNGNLTSTPIDRKGPRAKKRDFEIVIDAIKPESIKPNRSLYFGRNKKNSIINSDNTGTSCVWSDDENEGKSICFVLL